VNQSKNKHTFIGILYQEARKLWLMGCTVLGIGLSIALSACNALPIQSLTPTVARPTQVAIEDDFSSPNQNWVRFDTDEGAAYVLDDEFYLEDRGKGIAVHSPLLGQTWSDLLIEVQVRQVQGSMNNWMGILCRQYDEENYYLFAISADGYYLILKMEEGSPVPLIEPTATQSIRVGKATNYLKVHLHQDDLAFSVNNTLLVTRTDQAFDKGNVALFADAVEVGQTTVVAFDNFTLTPLDVED
jgi:hypothetical protein